MLPNINYDLRRSHPINLIDVQRKEVEFEDDLISTEEWKRELQTKGSSNHTTSSDEIIQKFLNELVEVKRQLPNLSNSYLQNYQNPPGGNNDGKFPQLVGLQPRLVIEVAPKKGNMCVFHLTTNHDSESCPKTTRMM